MKHTQGPWRVGHKEAKVYGPLGQPVADCTMVGWEVVCFEEKQATARLIAAAPDLLEACESLLLELINKGEYDTACIMAMNSAEKVIKKAKGE